jgi:hypothetical protein
MVKRETRSNFSAILASSLFAATFRISGSWFDIARVDSLFLFFLLTALYLIKFNDSLKSYILAGIFISLSFLTKQTALAISLPIMLYCILLGRRCSLSFIGTIIAIVGVSTLLLNYIHDGWYSYYVFGLLKQRHMSINRIVYFWIKDIISPLSVASFAVVFYLFTEFLSSHKKNYLFYLLTLIGMLGGSLVSRSQVGGYSNVLFPAYAIISILFGLAIHTASEMIQAVSENKRKIMEIYIYLVCTIQFVGLAYKPLAQIPTKEDLKAGKEFINTMAQLNGDILVPCHGYLPVLAGKKSHAHAMAIVDVLGSYSPAKAKLIDEIKQEIRKRRFSAIILDAPWFPEVSEKYYSRQGAVFDSPTIFWPVTGLRTRPEWIYVPKRDDTN